MSQETNGRIQEQTQQLLNGPLKHIRAAALAAALVPLASIAATPAHAEEVCGSGGVICGIVWNDLNKNGIQEAGEPGIPNAVITVNGELTSTGPDGIFYWGPLDLPPGTGITIVVQVPPNSQPSLTGQGTTTTDSDGTPDVNGSVSASFTFPGGQVNTYDFGFFTSAKPNPGTGTPGYWKNHPEAWPTAPMVIGGVSYTSANAIPILQMPDNKDKTLTLFSSLISAMLNVAVGNDDACVADAIQKGKDWFNIYPVGSKVAASSLAWKIGEPTHRHLDNYNNGMLCVDHRD